MTSPRFPDTGRVTSFPTPVGLDWAAMVPATPAVHPGNRRTHSAADQPTVGQDRQGACRESSCAGRSGAIRLFFPNAPALFDQLIRRAAGSLIALLGSMDSLTLARHRGRTVPSPHFDALNLKRVAGCPGSGVRLLHWAAPFPVCGRAHGCTSVDGLGLILAPTPRVDYTEAGPTGRWFAGRGYIRSPPTRLRPDPSASGATFTDSSGQGAGPGYLDCPSRPRTWFKGSSTDQRDYWTCRRDGSRGCSGSNRPPRRPIRRSLRR